MNDGELIKVSFSTVETRKITLECSATGGKTSRLIFSLTEAEALKLGEHLIEHAEAVREHRVKSVSKRIAASIQKKLLVSIFE